MRALLLSLLIATLGAVDATAQTVVRWRASVAPEARVEPGGTVEVTLDATIDAGWKLYALTQEGVGPQALAITVPDDSVVSLAGGVIGPLPFSAFDANFNIDTQYHTETATFYVPVALAAAAAGRVPVPVEVTWQTCTDRYCLPPATERLTLTVLVPGTGADVTPVESVARAGSAGTAGVEDMAAGAASQTLGAYLALAALMGALSLLTPCVFPMVPITVSYFTTRAERGDAGARSGALAYGVGIVLTFTVVGAVIALGFGASGLNQFAANPWLNLAIAALFVSFALSLFGVVNLSLPASWLTAASTAGGGLGRVGGPLLMALAFTLTSLTCTAPFLGTLLVVASQGEWLWPLAGLTVFATVFALPFVALAWMPRMLTALPRSGPWLVAVKASMGLLELAAALKFLSNVDLVWGWGLFTRPVVITAWVVLGVLLVVYLSGGARLGHAPRLSRPGPARTVTSAAVLTLTIWMSTGLMGRRLGELEAFLPPATLGGGHAGELSWMVNDYDGALAAARDTGRPLLIDFTGYTCTNCRWMEANMFTQPEVARELEQVVRLRLYTDGRGDDSRRFQALQRDTFGTVALPYYVVLAPDGRPIVAFGGLTRNRAHFVAFLQRGRQGVLP